MLSTSFEYRRKRPTLFKAELTLADGTARELTGEDAMADTLSISDAVSSDGSFDIGAAIINRMDVTLNNCDGRFDAYDFTGSSIVPYVGVALDSGGVEWLQKGVFGVDQPESYGGTIGLAALDNMRLLEVPYSEVRTAYPATLRTIVSDICAHCGLALADADFANGGYVVNARPDDSSLTCLKVVSSAAQASGNFARCDAEGRLRVRWYDTSAFEGEDWLDGGWYDAASPYASGDAADGGDFADYSGGAAKDGGTFMAGSIASVYALESATIMTDDVVVTGVRVRAQDEAGEDGTRGADGETALAGSEGYVLGISDNPLVQFGRASAVAEQVAARVVGMRFRPFEASAIGSPAYEAGDPVILTDRLQNQYTAYITRLTYKLGGYEAIACGAETPGRNTAASYSAATRAIVEARNAAKAERTARDIATSTLALMLAGASGLHKTEQGQDDGSTVYYLHDKPTLRESSTVWKVTANAFGVSTDGGRTYSYGVDSNGVAILNQIYAEGIDADYIETGTITAQDGLSRWNLLTGLFETSTSRARSDIDTGWAPTLEDDPDSEDVIWQDDEPDIGDYPYKVEHYNIVASTLRMSSDVFFGVYQTYTPYHDYIDRETGARERRIIGEQVDSSYAGGIEPKYGNVMLSFPRIYIGNNFAIEKISDNSMTISTKYSPDPTAYAGLNLRPGFASIKGGFSEVSVSHGDGVKAFSTAGIDLQASGDSLKLRCSAGSFGIEGGKYVVTTKEGFAASSDYGAVVASYAMLYGPVATVTLMFNFSSELSNLGTGALYGVKILELPQSSGLRPQYDVALGMADFTPGQYHLARGVALKLDSSGFVKLTADAAMASVLEGKFMECTATYVTKQ